MLVLFTAMKKLETGVVVRGIPVFDVIMTYADFSVRSNCCFSLVFFLSSFFRSSLSNT